MPKSIPATRPGSGDAAGTTPAERETGKPSRPDERPRPKEIGGPDGPEPTRYGDWERNGRCSDF